MSNRHPVFMTCVAKADACYLRENGGYLQYRSGEKGEWKNLIKLSEIAPAALNAEAIVVAELLCSLAGRISALEKKLSGNLGDVTVDKITILRGVDQYGSDGNAVIRGTGAPNIIPNCAGQEYIDLSTNDHYKAKGNSAVPDWQKINN